MSSCRFMGQESYRRVLPLPYSVCCTGGISRPLICRGCRPVGAWKAYTALYVPVQSSVQYAGIVRFRWGRRTWPACGVACGGGCVPVAILRDGRSEVVRNRLLLNVFMCRTLQIRNIGSGKARCFAGMRHAERQKSTTTPQAQLVATLILLVTTEPHIGSPHRLKRGLCAVRRRTEPCTFAPQPFTARI